MAINRTFTIAGQARVDAMDINSRLSVGSDMIIEATDNDVFIQLKNKRISLSELINRIEALETAYMEDKLLSTSDKIE